MAFSLFNTFSPALLFGLARPESVCSRSEAPGRSGRELPLDGARSLPVGVLRPPSWGAEGLRPEVAAVGKGGKAQSRLADSSGLGGRGSKSRGAVLVMLRGNAGFPLLPPDCELGTGEIGDANVGCSGRNDLLAASGLILGRTVGDRLPLELLVEPTVGALVLV